MQSDKNKNPLVGRLTEKKSDSLPRISYEAQPSNKILKRSYLPQWKSPSYILITGSADLFVLDQHLMNPRSLKTETQESAINNQSINDFSMVAKSPSGSLDSFQSGRWSSCLATLWPNYSI